VHRNRGLILALITLVFLSGCFGDSVSVIVPSSDVSLERAVETNLKQLDLTRMSKTKISTISGVALPSGAACYQIKYRHPDQPITITVAKFPDARAGDKFWLKWTGALLKANGDSEEPDKLAEGGGYWSFRDSDVSGLAWEQDSWFTFVSVPVAIPEADRLKEKVRDVLVLQYRSLGKQQND